MEAAKRICEQADKDLMDAMMQEVHDEIAQEEERGRERQSKVPQHANVFAEEGADTATPVPIYLCAALYIVMTAVVAAFPFEPMGKRNS